MPLLPFASAPLLQRLIARKENQAKKSRKRFPCSVSSISSHQFHATPWFLVPFAVLLAPQIVGLSRKDGPGCSQKWKRTFPRGIILFSVLERQPQVTNPGRQKGCKEKEKAVALGGRKQEVPGQVIHESN